MRAAVAVLGLFTLGAGAAVPAAADERIASDRATLERIMALAEMDLSLRRADLGLIGSVLPAAPIAKPSVVAASGDDGTGTPPAPAASPAVDAIHGVSSQR